MAEAAHERQRIGPSTWLLGDGPLLELTAPIDVSARNPRSDPGKGMLRVLACLAPTIAILVVAAPARSPNHSSAAEAPDVSAPAEAASSRARSSSRPRATARNGHPVGHAHRGVRR